MLFRIDLPSLDREGGAAGVMMLPIPREVCSARCAVRLTRAQSQASKT